MIISNKMKLILRLIRRAIAVAGAWCAAIPTTAAPPIPASSATTSTTSATSTISLRAAFLAPKEAKVCNTGILGLGREAVAIDGDLQRADVHAVELHVRLAAEGNLLLGGHVVVPHPWVARALDVERDELRGAAMESVDGTDTSVHHE